MLRAFLAAAALLLLGACGPTEPTAAVEGAVPQAQASTQVLDEPQLLAAYWTIVRLTDDVKNETSFMRYRPGQVAAGLLIDERDEARFLGDVGPYEGWDILITDPNGNYRTYDPGPFIHLELNRAATVVVAKRGGDTPAWLSSWEVTTGLEMICCSATGRAVMSNAWRRVLPAGSHDLGVVGSSGDPYIILLEEAEAGPVVEIPVPNEPCPAWVHEQFVSWHQQIDPEFWCYFGHEHGSDPAEFAGGSYVPAFDGSEPHSGFKGLLLRDASGREVFITAHLGSSSLSRACSRYHTLDMAFAEPDGEIVGLVTLKGDFGVPYAVEAGNKQFRVEPTACPGVADLVTAGKRSIPVEMPGTGYESWQWAPPAAVPFVGTFVIVTDNPMTRCTLGERREDGNYVCDTPAYHGDDQDGSTRWMIFPGSDPFGFDAADASGVFCTDAIASAVLDCGSSGAVEQFLKPGVRFTLTDGPGKWEVREPWRAVYENFRPQLIRINRNLEDQVPIPGSN